MITSPLEAALARLWSRILRVNDVGRNDDFLSLGGDRAGLAALIASINSLFRVDLRIESLPQDAMTIAGMARVITAGSGILTPARAGTTASAGSGCEP